MRPLIAVLTALAASASPAPAQDLQSLARENDLWAQQQLSRQRSITQENDFNALSDRLETEQRLRDLSGQQARPTVQVAPGPVAATVNSAMPSIPDAELAASRARVVAASQNRR